jgi:hypothetical protein
MFKKIVVLTLSLSFGMLMAQKNPCQINVEKELVSKIKKYSSKELIPYYSSKVKKWGYMDRESSQVLTTPFFDAPQFFNPDLTILRLDFDKGNLGCTGVIKGSNSSYDVSEFKEIRFEEPYQGAWEERMDFTRDDSRLVKESISGFEVNENGKLLYISPKFFDESTKTRMIRRIFSYKDEYFAIINKKDTDGEYYAIINQKGDVLKGFEYLNGYPKIIESVNTAHSFWIWYKNKEEKYVFKDFSNGVIKVILDDDLNEGSSVLWYVIAAVNDQKGILDVMSMEWKIPPAKENDFEKLYYTTVKSKQQAFNRSVEYNREDSYIYIRNSKNTFYDLDMKEYKPKK